MLNQNKETTAESYQQKETYIPRVDIYENKQELLVVADLPGVSPDSLNIRLENHVLALEGHAHKDNLPEGLTPYLLYRTFRVPRDIDADNIRAELKNGVLNLHLPRSPKAMPRQIQIHAE